MLRLFCCALLAFGFAFPAVVDAQIQSRAYAPENLRTLSQQDQARVIGLEYQEQSNGRRIPDDQLRFYIDQVNRSNWTFSRIKQDIAQSLGGSGSRPPVVGDTVRCESEGGRSRACPTPWRGFSRLSRQLSSTRCVQGQNWFSRPGQVTVSGGCRGEFAPGRGDDSAGDGTEIRCESTDNRLRRCGSNLHGNARLVRQLSGTRCIEGSTWGLRDGMLWVDRGCRGVFRVERGGWAPGMGGGWNPSSGAYSVTCASEQRRQTTCAWDARRGRPELLQQLSSTPCQEGTSWGYRAGQIWVSGGCRARFGVR